VTRHQRLVVCSIAGASGFLQLPESRGIIDPEAARRAGIDLRSIGHPSLAGPTVPLAATSQIG
jgi:hypothetical protein